MASPDTDATTIAKAVLEVSRLTVALSDANAGSTALVADIKRKDAEISRLRSALSRQTEALTRAENLISVAHDSLVLADPDEMASRAEELAAYLTHIATAQSAVLPTREG